MRFLSQRVLPMCPPGSLESEGNSDEYTFVDFIINFKCLILYGIQVCLHSNQLSLQTYIVC